MKRFLPILFVLFILLTGCQSAKSQSTDAPGKVVEVPGGSYRDISSSELKSMLDNKDFVFVNVHIPYEGEIENTDLFIPYDQIQQDLDKLPEEKNAKVVLYCRSGRMSTIAAKELVGLGYTNLYNLDDGFQGWEQADYPLKK